MEWQFERIAQRDTLTEGPAWDGTGLLFTEIAPHVILRWEFATGELSTFREGSNGANGLMFDPQGQLFACEGEGDGRRIVRYEADGGVTVIADRFAGKRLNSPNDLAIDPQGRIWFTDPRYGDKHEDRELDHESVYRLDPEADGSYNITRVTFDTTKPNGILVSPDQQWLYVVNSDYGEERQRDLRAYPIQPDGSLGAHEVLHDFGPHRGIDGMCLDADGNIVATAGFRKSGPGPMLYVFTPKGRVLETHPLPEEADRPTNCSWGGPDLTTLFVTTGSGFVYRVPTDRRGLLHWPRPV